MRCIVRTMIIYTTDSLFAWNRLDDSPDLKTIRDFFELLPDGPLLEALRVNRGRGRNDRPIRVLWFCAVPLLPRRYTVAEAIARPPPCLR